MIGKRWVFQCGICPLLIVRKRKGDIRRVQDEHYETHLPTRLTNTPAPDLEVHADAPTLKDAVVSAHPHRHEWGEWEHEDYLGRHYKSVRLCLTCGEADVELAERDYDQR